MLRFLLDARCTYSQPCFQKRNGEIDGNELECGQAHDFAGSGLCVGIMKAYIALLDIDDTGVLNSGAEDVGSEIADAASMKAIVK